MTKPVILTVDDDPEVLRAIERDLRRQYASNYRVLRAELSCHALLVATGVQWRKLDAPGVERLTGAGSTTAPR